MDQEQRYLNIVLNPIRVCARYQPKMGQGTAFGLTEFQQLYGADHFYSWFGLDHPLMYAAHKAAGGMTSIYRQIGIGCEALIRAIFQDYLNLSEQEVVWSYEVARPDGRNRKLSLDGRINLNSVRNQEARDRLTEWTRNSANRLMVNPSIRDALQGTVFEVRQGYKSKDSKRQNADIANASTAYSSAYLPVAMILSTQIDVDIQMRYTAEKWLVLTGNLSNDPYSSTYAFMNQMVGFDLAQFFYRNSERLRYEILQVLQSLLSPQET